MSKFRTILATLKKHAPKILFGAGIAGSVVATVLAIKKGMEVKELIEDDVKELERLKEDDSEEAVKQRRVIRRKIFVRLAKHLVGVIIVELGSCAAMTYAFATVSRRLAEATVALVALDSFASVNGELPEELESEEQKEPSELSQEELDIIEAKKLGFGPLAIRITPDCGCWTERRMQLITELCHLEEVLTDRFQARPEFGLFANELFESLEVDQEPRFRRQIKLSRTYGWLKGNGDEYVDLGIREAQPDGSVKLSLAAQKFVDCEVNYLWLNPNVDGPIVDKI